MTDQATISTDHRCEPHLVLSNSDLVSQVVRWSIRIHVEPFKQSSGRGAALKLNPQLVEKDWSQSALYARQHALRRNVTSRTIARPCLV